MLRITVEQQADQTMVALHGKLLAPWLDELRAQCGGGAPLRTTLDLAGLTFVDHAGAALLDHLQQSGYQLRQVSAFVQAQLDSYRSRVAALDPGVAARPD